MPEENKAKHTYILKIDSVCKKCNFRNKGVYNLEENMNVVCCGNCGTVISMPNTMDENDKNNIEMCVKEALKDELKSKPGDKKL